MICAASVAFAQAGRGSSSAASSELMGCVSGGNLQPVEQPFVLEPAEPFELIDVVRRDAGLRLVAVPTKYQITGIDMTPWLGMRVKVEGVVVDQSKADQAGRTKGLPQIRADRVTSIWGTCPSRPAWTPVPQPK
jgi:hypothetical protein